MSKRKRQKIEAQLNSQLLVGLGYKVTFFAYLIFCALTPIAVENGLSYSYVVLVQVLISALFVHHWVSIINFNESLTGYLLDIYQKIDKVQFKNTNFLNVGFKTKSIYTSGSVVNMKVSKILAERYDLLLLVISMLGLALIFISTQNQWAVSRGLLSILMNYLIAKCFLAAIGGYMFLCGFSLFSLGIISRVSFIWGSK